MAISRSKKEQIIARLEAVKADSASIVFVGFSGLTVAEVSDVRRTLRAENVSYLVAKKTLITRVLGPAFTGTMPDLPGEVAIAWSNDAIAPAQQIKVFAQKYKEKLNILGGVFEGVFKSQAEMTEIASIPSLQVLRGMFVNVINSPIQGMAIVLAAIAEKKTS